MNGIFVTATDTSIGKTLVAGGLAAALRKYYGKDAGVMKPVQSGSPSSPGGLCGDALFLQEMSQVDDAPELINPYSAPAALAPALALDKLGISADPQKIKEAFAQLEARHDLVIVEGAGGLLVPVCGSFTMADLAALLEIPVIIVARAGLGTVNHTLLSIESARRHGLDVLGVVLNQEVDYSGDESLKDNAGMIEEQGSVKVLGLIPHIPELEMDSGRRDELAEIIRDNVDMDALALDFRNAAKERSRQLKENDKRLIWHPFTQMQDFMAEEPLVIEEGRGVYLKDTDGRWYIDGVSSLWVNVHGHRRKEIDDAVIAQLGRLAHSTLLGLGNVPAVECARKLLEIVPGGLSRVFYSDNGSTAVEVSLKMAFQYWQQKGHREKERFVTFTNAYHGDTLGSVSAGGIDLFHHVYRPLLFHTIKAKAPYCYRCPFDCEYPSCELACLKHLEKILEENHRELAGLVIEPLMQGAAGMITQPDEYLHGVRDLCSRYDVLMIADEVATGFGRSGSMFACRRAGVEPDLMAVAKGFSGGYLPLAATVVTEEVFSGFLGEYTEQKTFFHGHTYTGNPLACAAAIASIDLFAKEDTLGNVNARAKELARWLEEISGLDHVGDTRQKGLMAGVELVESKESKREYPFENKTAVKVILEARKKGLIIRPLGDVIVMMPPLAISREVLAEMLEIISESIKIVTD